jgi:hypothetical protein
MAATCSSMLANFPRTTTGLKVLVNHVQRRNMPVNVPPTATGKRRFRLPVETDPHKLVNYCCGLNYHKDEPPVKLKDDHEYPDWLWSLRLGPKPNSWEMEEGTKEYYLRLAEEQRQENYIKRMTSPPIKKVVDKALKSHQEYLHHIRFAALAHLEDDVGLELDSMPQDWELCHTMKVNKSDYYLPMEEDRVLYMDKIEGNRSLKNFHRDVENSFLKGGVSVKPHRPIKLKAIQDSKRRHRYTCT